ncbi:glycosyltransferase family 2 protein [Thiohalocapsa marina]|nr:glycosyltransferase family 2 protein [Thiohalocapsa marina]
MSSELVYDSGIRNSEGLGKAPFITVCLSTYRFEGTVVRAIESLLAQTYKDFEIVISDDASPDSTVAAALDYLKVYAGSIRIRLYRSRYNQGIVGNRLTAMSYAEGELFVQTDGDDFSMPQRLEKIAEFWRNLPDKPSILATNALRWYESSGKAGEPVLADVNVGLFPPGDPVYGKTVVFSAGYVVSRTLYEAFREVVPQSRLIADDPVFARRAALLDGLIFMPEPVFYYGTSTASASGGGEWS